MPPVTVSFRQSNNFSAKLQRTQHFTPLFSVLLHPPAVAELNSRSPLISFSSDSGTVFNSRSFFSGDVSPTHLHGVPLAFHGGVWFNNGSSSSEDAGEATRACQILLPSSHRYSLRCSLRREFLLSSQGCYWWLSSGANIKTCLRIWISSFQNSSSWQVNPIQRGCSGYYTSSESETPQSMAATAKLDHDSTGKGILRAQFQFN